MITEAIKPAKKDKKKSLRVVTVPPNGRPDWYLGAYSLVFVYSKYDGNFLVKGYRGDVLDYLKKNHTHYFYYVSMWSSHGVRGHWQFWKDGVSIYAPAKMRKDWKFKITNRGFSWEKKVAEPIEYKLKRLPKRWIPEFDKF